MSDDNQHEVNPVFDMIQHALDQDYNKANDVFNNMMTIKQSDLIDQEKIRIAGQVYNGVDPDEDEEDQLELDLETEDDDEEEETWDDEEEDEDLLSDEELDDILDDEEEDLEK